jgi:cell wall assembly regulator SMI1
MKLIYSVIDELLKFSSRVLTLNDRASEDKINEFEKNHNLVLPNDYKILLRRTNGLDLMGSTVYGIYDESVIMSLDGVFKFEHYEVENEMPDNLIPFSPDGRGNHYCFDSAKCNNESCKVIFWDHELIYDMENPPEIVNDSFAEWANQVLIEWILEQYDHNGNPRE